MSHSHFEFDAGALGKLTDTPEARALLEEIGQAAVYSIRRATPVETGRLRKSIYSKVTKLDGQLVALVGTRVPYWHILQFGSADVSPKRYFDRGINALHGVRYAPSPKE